MLILRQTDDVIGKTENTVLRILLEQCEIQNNKGKMINLFVTS